MQSRSAGGLRLGWLTALLLGILASSHCLLASSVTDSARQLAHKIAAVSGPGTVSIDVTSRSSLDDKSVEEIRNALETQLRAEGVRNGAPEQATGTVHVTLSESLREYVWTAEITTGSTETRAVLIAVPRPQPGPLSAPVMPVILKKDFLFAQEPPVLDAILVEMSGGLRLLLLESDRVALYQQTGGRWQPEMFLTIPHSRTFPRDLRGRLMLGHDHLFDAYLPGTVCRSSATLPLTLACSDSDDPWPLTFAADGVRSFYASSRNFFTGAISPAIGKISNVPSFYSAAALPRATTVIWILSAVDGSIHLIDGSTDQSLRGVRWGSDLAGVHSGCGTGAQVLVTESGATERDSIRAFEIPDREPVPASSALQFDGPIVGLWPEADGSVLAITRRVDSGWYEADRISITCGS